MPRISKCREMRELFPLLFNGSLNRRESDRVELHLDECAECRSMYNTEQSLFRSAEEVAPMMVGEHPQGTTLDNLVNSPDRLRSDEAETVLKHLGSCEICAEAVENLKKLPADMDELVATKHLSIIVDPAADSVPPLEIAKVTRIGWHRQARPLFAFAAAAMILIVAVYYFQSDRQVRRARVDAIFPTITRSADSMLSFESDSGEFVLAARVHVGPETGHSYSLSLLNPISDSIIFLIESLVDFDSLGYAAFEQSLIPGRYELRVLDIERGDTITISRPFEVRLKD